MVVNVVNSFYKTESVDKTKCFFFRPGFAAEFQNITDHEILCKSYCMSMYCLCAASFYKGQTGNVSVKPKLQCPPWATRP